MNKTVNINNGVGTIDLINGSYTVTSNTIGYDDTTISPSSITVEEGTNTYSFTIAATGALTIHVTEDKTESGTPVVGATFVRTDENGVEYGTPITTNSSGDAVFNNVPFATENAPVIYFRQTASDGNHEFDNTVQNTTMTSDTSTIQIQNTIGATRTINLTDANYENLPIETSILTLTN